jgi:hypothetical protein
MAEPHPAAIHHLPSFITPPGESDVLMIVMGAILLLAVLAFGILFLRLHSLPERIAHKSHKLQFELVAVLALIALFTHMHIFWVAALLLAIIDLPDFGTSLGRMAVSLEKIAGIKTDEGANDERPASGPDVGQPETKRLDETPLAPRGTGAVIKDAAIAPAVATKPQKSHASAKEPTRA